jgi:redox-sensitive bicupin YhaK (pirin superfamily)
VTPRYDQKSFDIANQINTFVNIVSPNDQNDGNALWVYQETFFHLGIFDSNTSTTYKVRISNNGVYLFLIEGEIEVNNQVLTARDAMGITDFNQFEIKINAQSKILLVEVPMKYSQLYHYEN